MTGQRLRTAFISGVRHAASYMDILSRDPRVEIVGVGEEPGAAEWIRRDSEATAHRLGAPYVTELAGLLDPARVDLAVICSEPTRHARLATEAIQAGLHVVVDKPIATTLANAEAVRTAAAQARGRCSVVNRTHAPALRRVRRWIDAGYIGLPHHVDVEFLASGTHFATSVERPELVIDPALSGGGELLNFLGYCVDAVRYLTGLEVRNVHAFGGTLFDAGHARFGVEDTAVVSLLLDRGVTATATVGRIPFAPSLGSASTSLRIIGSHGHAIADDGRPAVLQYGGDSTMSVHPVAGGRANETLVAYLAHVVDALLAGGGPDYGIDDALAAMAVIDAAYQSINRHTAIDVG